MRDLTCASPVNPRVGFEVSVQKSSVRTEHVEENGLSSSLFGFFFGQSLPQQEGDVF